MNIFDQYGIKEVCDVTIYSIHKKEDGSGDIYYLPALYLDTLKVSTVEKTADNVWAEGGLGNARLINWDFGKEINLTLEDALCTPASLGMCWNGVLSTNWKNGHVETKLGIQDEIDRLERMEKCFYPRGDKKSISQLLPQTQDDTELIAENGDILTRSEVLDGIIADGFGEVNKRSYRWDLEVDSRIKSIAQVPRKFFDIYGRSHLICKRRTIGVAPYKALGSFYTAYGTITLGDPIKIDASLTKADDIKEAILNYINEYTPLATFKGTYKNSDNNLKTITKQTRAYDISAVMSEKVPEVAYELIDSSAATDTASTTDADSTDTQYKFYTNIVIGKDTTSTDDSTKITTTNTVKANVYHDINNVNEDIKYSVTYKINEPDNEPEKPYGTVIELDPKNLNGNGILELLDDAKYLQIRVLNDGTYHAGVIFSAPTVDGNKTVLETIDDYDFYTVPINIDSASASGNYFVDVTKWINIEQFKHIDMWLTFDSLNEMTYYILTTFQDNIKEIVPKSLIGTTEGEQNEFPDKYYRAGEAGSTESALISNKLWCYINPKTMTPYADDYWFHQGEPFYKKSLTLKQKNKKLKGSRIFVEAGKWPGMYRIVGETYMRARDTGEDERVQIEFPLAKIRSDQTLTLEADGDPTTFTMDVEIAQPKSGNMMIITPYEVEKVTGTNEFGEEVEFDGSTQIKAE